MKIQPNKDDKLWTPKRRYRCGCEIVKDKHYCPVHGEPLLEMIYGNKSKADILNEKEEYRENNLNESK